MSRATPHPDALLARSEFLGDDCVWTNGRFVAHAVVGDAIVLAPDVALDLDATVDATPLFSQAAGDATYGGGESLSHGSYGFFFKRGAHGVEWALFSHDSDPFLGVDITPTQVRFQSQSGDVWVVEGDDVTRTRIERGPGYFDPSAASG